MFKIWNVYGIVDDNDGLMFIGSFFTKKNERSLFRLRVTAVDEELRLACYLQHLISC